MKAAIYYSEMTETIAIIYVNNTGVLKLELTGIPVNINNKHLSSLITSGYELIGYMEI